MQFLCCYLYGNVGMLICLDFMTTVALVTGMLELA